MTAQEAIKRIENHIEVHSRKEPFAIKITEALNIAISALKKQIPTNVKNKTLGYDGEYADCPNCGKLICEYRNLKRCPECGQALDWSDTE